MHRVAPILAPALLAVTALAAPALAGVDAPVRFAQLAIVQRSVVKVRPLPPALAKPIRWDEKRGPKCVPVAALAGAIVTARDRIDLVLRGGRRVRAKLEDCHGLDFYSGFYLKPAADGMVCADRDTIRARSGASCEIDNFRLLVPKR